MTNSINTKLQVYLLTAIFSVLLGSAWIIYYIDKKQINIVSDFELQQVAELFVKIDLSNKVLPLTNGPLFNSKDDFAIVIWDQNNNITHVKGIEKKFITQPKQVGFFTISIHDTIWRAYVIRTDDRTIEALQPKFVQDDFIREATFKISFLFFLISPILILLIHIVVKQGLASISEINHHLGNTDENNLNSLKLRSVPLELIPLVATLNNLFKKLNFAMTLQKKFVSDAAHELRTPVTALILQVEHVKKAYDEIERERALSHLELGLERINRLISQLLVLARSENAFYMIESHPIRLDKILTEVVIHYAPLAEKKQIDLGIMHLDECVKNMNSLEVEAIFSNLIDNAIRYTDDNGTIDINFISNEKECIFQIKDTGIGIDLENKQKIFDRFYRISNTSTGSGLGLSITNEICQKYNIKIKIEDNTPRGTIFSVYL